MVADGQRPFVVGRREIRSRANPHVSAAFFDKTAHCLAASWFQRSRLFAAAATGEDDQIKLSQYAFANTRSPNTSGEHIIHS